MTTIETAAKERENLKREAQDAAAKRISSATSIGSADAAQIDFRFRLKRIKAMDDAHLVGLAKKRKESASQASKENLLPMKIKEK